MQNKALGDLVPHLLPRHATDIELRTRLSHAVQRYDLSLACVLEAARFVSATCTLENSPAERN